MSNNISNSSSGGSHFRPNLESVGTAGKLKGSAGERKFTMLKQGKGGVEVPTSSTTATSDQTAALRRRTAKLLDPKKSWLSK